MKISEMHALDIASLKKQLDDLSEEMFKLRLKRAGGSLSNHNRLGEVRREIARVRTLLRQRERPVVPQATTATEAKAK